MYEVFNRLNTGGIKLSSQEIRASLFYCPFYNMMQKLNNNNLWRRLQDKTKDLRSKDIEYILTGFAFMEKVDEYQGSKQKFLNKYSFESTKFTDTKIKKLENIFKKFLVAFSDIDKEIFCLNKTFSVLVFETLFAVLCETAYKNNGEISEISIDIIKIKELLKDTRFKSCLITGTATTETIERKYNIARSILLS